MLQELRQAVGGPQGGKRCSEVEYGSTPGLDRNMMPARERLCACNHGPHKDHAKWNGVRSYLHLFCEDCGGAAHPGEVEDPNPNNEDTCDWSSPFWKGVVSLSLLLLLLGAAALTTGYAVPPKLEGIRAGEFLVLDQRAAQYNKALGTCCLAGRPLCAVAAILLSICMLLVLLTQLKPEPKAEPVNRENEEAHVSMLCPPKPASQVSPFWVQQQEVSFLPSPPGGNLCPGLV